MLKNENQILLNRYKILNLIKRGAMGVIYMAEDLHLERTCAVKELLIDFSNTSGEDINRAIENFKREARMLAELHHTNLPKVYDYFVSEDKYFLVMDYIKGDDLLSLINRRAGGFPEDVVVTWLFQLCSVLDYLHTHDPPIIYRDVKPSNIMLREKDRNLILIDFGIAVISSGNLPLKKRNSPGTLGYVSPEQCDGKASPAGDIYSLGATAYHLLTGHVPPVFTEITIKEKREDISDGLEKIISKCLKKNAGERYETIKDLLGELKKLQKKKTNMLAEETIIECQSVPKEECYNLNQKNLYNIIYNYISQSNSGKLIIKDEHEEGEIYLNKGDITGAKLGHLSGEEALNSFFTWSQGLVFYSCEVIDTIEIDKSTSSILRECLRIDNELQSMRKELPLLKLDQTFIFNKSLPANGEHRFSPLEIAVIAYIKNNLSIREVAHKVNRDYFKILKIIYKLYKENIFLDSSVPERNIKILIVDDEEEIRKMIISCLENNDKFQLESAGDGVECCLKLNIFKPDIILLDICMPDIDGYETCKVIDKMPKFSRPKVLIITAIKNDLIESLRGKDYIDILYKPFRLKELHKKIEEIIEKINTQKATSYLC
ncbi:MAG: protein kinase [Candidatus Eremiobacterota bacterium]